MRTKNNSVKLKIMKAKSKKTFAALIAMAALMISVPTYGLQYYGEDQPIIVHGPHRSPKKPTTPITVSFNPISNSIDLSFFTSYKDVSVVVLKDGIPIICKNLGDVNSGLYEVPFEEYDADSDYKVWILSEGVRIVSQSL